jgi:hypothetical protein
MLRAMCSIIDYQHDPSDVVGGALLGTMIALVYLLRAIPRWKRVLQEDGLQLGGPSGGHMGPGGCTGRQAGGEAELGGLGWQPIGQADRTGRQGGQGHMLLC